MRRTLALAVLAAVAVAAPVPAAQAAPRDAVDCFRQYVTRADPVPQTPEEYVEATVRDANRTAAFALCVAS
jgi:hypothetical protein